MVSLALPAHLSDNPQMWNCSLKEHFSGFLSGSVLQGLIHFFLQAPRCVHCAKTAPEGSSAQLRAMVIGVLTMCLRKRREIKVHKQILTLSNILGA